MMYILKKYDRRRSALIFSISTQFRLMSVTLFILYLSYFSMGSYIQQSFYSEKPVFQVGFEGNSSVYRWANGYQETMIPTFNTTREARRSAAQEWNVVSGGLFSIVSFDNVPCNSDSLEVGTCYSNRECKNLGGVSSGICAGSYGTCCVVKVTCGGHVTTNNTYFTNPDYPSPTAGPLTCSITVDNLNGATELYLEMIEFSIRGPTSGACLNDTFTLTTALSPTVSSLPILCGNNTGEALYVPIATGGGTKNKIQGLLNKFGKGGSGGGSTTLTFNLANGDDGRIWKIRLVQFKPGDACFAPAGCTQWFREPTGTFNSFNYGTGMGELINNYCINACFAINPPNCGVILTEGTFMLPGMAPNDCPDGYYLGIGDQRYCGDTLNNGMIIANITTANYAQLMVCSGRDNPDMDLGFSLNYSPFPCTMIG